MRLRYNNLYFKLLEKTVKKLFVYSLDIILLILVVSMFTFIGEWVILSIMAVVMFFVLEHYLIMRNCYLEEK